MKHEIIRDRTGEVIDRDASVSDIGMMRNLSPEPAAHDWLRSWRDQEARDADLRREAAKDRIEATRRALAEMEAHCTSK